MKKILTLFILMTITITVFAQTDYDRGYKEGFKAGYCYNDYGCIAPFPPITPILNIGEDANSYQDGYNRGFKRGLEDKQAKKSSGVNQIGQQGTYPQQQYQSSTYTPPDYSFLLQALQLKEQQYEQEQEYEKKQAVIQMEQTISYYSTFKTYPDKIKDGWHKVMAMNNLDFCEERKVYVSDNKITKYVKNDWDEVGIYFSGVINAGKGLIKLDLGDGTQSEFIDVYFIEDITNPSVIVTAPLQPGKACFWTSWKNSGSLQLSVEGVFVGTFNSYFASGAPICGQTGTITFSGKPGTYNWSAQAVGSFTTRNWSGTFTISANGCTMKELTLK